MEKPEGLENWVWSGMLSIIELWIFPNRTNAVFGAFQPFKVIRTCGWESCGLGRCHAFFSALLHLLLVPIHLHSPFWRDVFYFYSKQPFPALNYNLFLFSLRNSNHKVEGTKVRALTGCILCFLSLFVGRKCYRGCSPGCRWVTSVRWDWPETWSHVCFYYLEGQINRDSYSPKFLLVPTCSHSTKQVTLGLR